jgi:hypothetical protein
MTRCRIQYTHETISARSSSRRFAPSIAAAPHLDALCAATIDRRRARALASRARVESRARRRLRGRDDATTRERRRDDG